MNDLPSLRPPGLQRRTALAALLLGAAGPALGQRARLPVERLEIVGVHAHDPKAFTQGLICLDGQLFESTGLHGRSSVRRVGLSSGLVLQQRELPGEYFGEGLTNWKDSLILLTWQSEIGFVLDRRTFATRRTFRYEGEGWGITQDGRQLYMSDGSASLRVLDPESLKELRRIPVTANGQPVNQLNELEWVDGEIYANVWQTDLIARINPANGQVLGWLDLSGLLASQGLPAAEVDLVDVLNGIAYDRVGKRLFITGKLWPRLFEVRRRLLPG